MPIRDIEVTLANLPDYLRQEGGRGLDSVKVVSSSEGNCVLEITGEIPARVLDILRDMDIILRTIRSIDDRFGILMEFYEPTPLGNGEDDE